MKPAYGTDWHLRQMIREILTDNGPSTLSQITEVIRNDYKLKYSNNQVMDELTSTIREIDRFHVKGKRWSV